MQIFRPGVHPWEAGASGQYRLIAREESQGQCHLWAEHRTEKHQRLPNGARTETKTRANMQDSSSENAAILRGPGYG